MERPTELKAKQIWNGLYPVASNTAAAADDDDVDQSQILNLF